jgi:DNA-binding FadR family transcriptional regulator
MAASGRHRDADLLPGSAAAPPGRLTAVSPLPGARDPKLAERIAASIEAGVVRAGWPVGRVIGSEDQLAARYGAGRAVIREAIRLAEHRQVARMRRGRGGGLVVVEPDASAVTESLSIYLEYAQVGADDLLAARTVLEVFAAGAAAGSADEGHRAALRQAVQDEDRREGHRRGGWAGLAGGETPRVHGLIAEATGNAALSLFIHVIVSLSSQLTAGGPPGRDGPGHRAIADAIAAGDVPLARDRMREHMTALRTDLTRPGARAGPGRGDAAAGGGAGPGAARPPGRPADAVAARIRREIVRRGWPVGESLGFEGDLLREYGIGRAQFREAIRILENHSVVRMQRGAAGGMVVAAPDGRALARAVSLYLTYRGMNAGHIRDLRDELEAAAVRLAIERLDGAGEERLLAMLDLERTWPDDGFRAVSHDLHAIIAELSGNQALALLVSIVMQLTAERLHAGEPGRVTEPPDATRHAHQAIVRAIIARDPALALRRMRTHLRALARWTVDSSPRPPR